jgi:hypothetical protein
MDNLEQSIWEKEFSNEMWYSNDEANKRREKELIRNEIFAFELGDI